MTFFQWRSSWTGATRVRPLPFQPGRWSLAALWLAGARTREEPTTERAPNADLGLDRLRLGCPRCLILIASALFTAGGYFGSDDTTVDVSPLALVVWGGLVALAVATWLVRRLKERR